MKKPKIDKKSILDVLYDFLLIIAVFVAIEVREIVFHETYSLQVADLFYLAILVVAVYFVVWMISYGGENKISKFFRKVRGERKWNLNLKSMLKTS